VLRHAGPTTAEVQVSPAGGDVLVRVGDGGRGAAGDAATSGRGLAGLRGRGCRMIRVVLADDEELVRMGLRVLIEREDDLSVVGEAASGHEALRLVRQ